MGNKNERRPDQYRDGKSDRLIPLESLDIKKIDNFSDLLRAMERTAFGGRSLGEAAKVLAAMVEDEECVVVGTFSGAMTVAKMGLLICDMIDWGWLDIIISTGALMAHGLVEGVGMLHFKYDPSMNDRELYRRGYNRVYDTLELEKNLDNVERIFSEILETLDQSKPISSEIVCRKIGEWLSNNVSGPGILKSAYNRRVPVYVPAFTDSELGLDFATWMMKKELAKTPDISPFEGLKRLPLNFNPFLDLCSYAERVANAKRIGIFTIGGGVPRNWAQQVGPFLEIARNRCQVDIPQKKFHYGVRICPEPVHWGGLSGCTYQEGISWGKFIPPEEGGMYAEVYCDATIAWPILVKGVKERIK